MERIEKLTEIYLENIHPQNSPKITHKNLKNCLIDVLDSIAYESKSTSSSIIGISPTKNYKISNENIKGESLLKIENVNNIESSISSKFLILHINIDYYRNSFLFTRCF